MSYSTYYNTDDDNDDYYSSSTNQNQVEDDVNNSNNNNYYMDYMYKEDQQVEETSLYFILFTTLLAFGLIVCKVLHDHPIIHSYVSEAALVLLVGMIAGFFIHTFFFTEAYQHNNNNNNNNNGNSNSNTNNYNSNNNNNNNYDNNNYDNTNYGGFYVNPLAESWLSFNPTIFFMAMLPPIIFNSGYQLRRELFYRHIKPILLFAVVGTTISAIVTGMILYGISLLGLLNITTTTITTTTTTTSSSSSSNTSNIFAPTLLELLTFGSLIAATDTVSVLSVFQSKKVDPHLFYLVFGESALNDAVALVLFNTFANFIIKSSSSSSTSTSTTSSETTNEISFNDFTFLFQLIADGIGSPILGVLSSFGIAFLFKCIDFRTTPHLELPLFLLLMYIPFIIAECITLSGIVTIFFSGISARRYVVPNVSTITATNAEEIFKTTSYVAEICIFLELGLSVFGLPLSSFRWSFIAWSFIASLVGRAVGIYPLAYLFNLSLKERTDSTINQQQQCQQHETEQKQLQKQKQSMATTTTNYTVKSGHNDGSTPRMTTLPVKYDDHTNHRTGMTVDNNYDVAHPATGTSSNPRSNLLTLPANELPIAGSEPQRTTSSTKKKKKLIITPQRRMDKRIPTNFIHVIWFAGLRGAVAYACARRFPNINGNADEIMACTMVIVVVSIVVMGGLTESLLHILQITINVDERLYMKEWHKERHLKGIFHEYEKTYIYRNVVREDAIRTANFSGGGGDGGGGDDDDADDDDVSSSMNVRSSSSLGGCSSDVSDVYVELSNNSGSLNQTTIPAHMCSFRASTPNHILT